MATPISSSGSAVDNGNGVKASPAEQVPRRAALAAKAKSLWAKTGIDWRTYQSMFKGALAPTIAVAAYQGTAFAETFTTVGYLVAIMSILSIVIAPRAKFLQTMLINVLFTCTACAVALLAMFCNIAARTNSVGFSGPGTGGPGTSGLASSGAATAGYNSSASAVSGVWLFVEIYFISVIRAKNPQYTVPSIMAAIFANVSMTYAPQFSTMAQAEAFAYHLLTAFLTGFAIATGVSLLVFPLTSRQVVFKGMAAYIGSLRSAVQANLVYIRSLEDTDMFDLSKVNTAGERSTKEAAAFKAAMRTLQALQGKLHTDLPFAKREVAMGKLGPDDLQEVVRLLRLIMIPTLGLSCMPDVFDFVSEEQGWARTQDRHPVLNETSRAVNEKLRVETVNEWHELMKLLREPFGEITEAIDEGLQHVSITLQLIPQSLEADGDVEAEGSEPRPGGTRFTPAFELRSRKFLQSKRAMLQGWCRMHGIELPPEFFDNPGTNFDMPQWMREGYLSDEHKRLRKQLFLCLYIEFLLYNVSRKTLDLMIVADGLRQSGKLSRTRLVVPGFKRMRKWFMSLLSGNGDTHGDEMNTDGHQTTVDLGQAYKEKKDPEHLPPTTAWERAGEHLRKIAHFFQSPASTFGFRCACATLSIAVVCYLKASQVWYTTTRLFWAQIMVSISMSPSAGQSLRNFLLRITGTLVAMLLSWISWYIVDGHTAGILVFLFIFLHAGPYILLKMPQYTTLGMIGPITMVLIVGYELQVRKIGIAEATSNGQAYFPIYELGPIRLATVCGGLLVAWIWTVLPYPLTERNQMRKSLGSALYLLANYYSVTHETVRVRLKDEQGDLSLKESPGRKLDKIRLKLFNKANLTIDGLRTQAGFLKFDIPVGGKFPFQQYESIVNDLQSALNFMSLVSLASQSFTDLQHQKDHGFEWLASFRKLVGEANVNSQQVTTLLSLMSASVTNGQPLPPYLRAPEGYALSRRLDELDKDLLNVRHIAEPGYSSFAVIQIGTKCIADHLKRLVNGAKDLVGEMDFSFHIVSTAGAADSANDI